MIRASGRVLFAGEPGDGSAVQARIAADLAARGIETVFALPGAAGIAPLLSAAAGFDLPPFGILQAPTHFQLPSRVPEPRNHVDLLINRGFGDPDLLYALINAWRGTLRLADPGVVVACDRPDALLAARLAGLPVIQLSQGLAMPPAEQPLPVLRPWVEQAPQRREVDEALVLRHINVLFDSAGQPRLRALHELFAGGTRLITSLPELDPYGPRADCGYCGPLQGAGRGRRLKWPGKARRKVLVHLRDVPAANAKAMQTLLGALVRRDSATHALLPADAHLPRASAFHASASMNRVHRAGADWRALLADADLCLFDGDPQVASACALAGVPMICTPVSVEGFLLARRIVAAGIGAGVGLVAPDLRGRLKAVLRQFEDQGPRARMARAARALARRHAQLNPEEAVRRLGQAIAQAMASGAGEGMPQSPVERSGAA